MQPCDIFRAIETNNKKAILGWFKSKPNIDELNEQGQTPLIICVKKNKKRWLKKLLNLGAHVNAIDKSGKTALDYAVERKNKPLTLELCKHNAKVTTEQNLSKVQLTIKRKTKKMKIVAGVFGVMGALSFASNLSQGRLSVPVGDALITGCSAASAVNWSNIAAEYDSSMILKA